MGPFLSYCPIHWRPRLWNTPASGAVPQFVPMFLFSMDVSHVYVLYSTIDEKHVHLHLFPSEEYNKHFSMVSQSPYNDFFSWLHNILWS